MAIQRPQNDICPTLEMRFALLRGSLDELAQRYHLEIDFCGDGPGPIREMGFQTTSGHVYQLSEWELRAQDQLGVSTDATVLAKLGAEPLLADLIAELGVSRCDFCQVADAAVQADAAKKVAMVEDWKHRALLPKQYDGEISFDLFMEDDMSFVEGTYRLRQGEWRVFSFSRYEGKRVSSENQQWESGVGGWRIKTPQELKLNRESVMKILGDLLYVEQWLEVRGPDSMKLR
jgi:hypothetical protein